MSYTYTKPAGKLYKVSIRKWNKHFGNRGRFIVVECYIDDDVAVIQYIYSPLGKLLTTLLFPLAVLIHGFGNIKEIWNDQLGVISPKKYGAFSSDVIYRKRGEQWDKLHKMLGIEEGVL